MVISMNMGPKAVSMLDHGLRRWPALKQHILLFDEMSYLYPHNQPQNKHTYNQIHLTHSFLRSYRDTHCRDQEKNKDLWKTGLWNPFAIGIAAQFPN